MTLFNYLYELDLSIKDKIRTLNFKIQKIDVFIISFCKIKHEDIPFKITLTGFFFI